jgi:hypothetical protein
MIFGCIARARAIATRCCWPAGQLGRVLRLLRDPDPLEQLHPDLLGARDRPPPNANRRQGDVLQHGEMREQVERLEHHADLAAHRRHVADVVGELDAVDDDVAALVLLEPVDGADEGRLAGARRPEDDDHLAALHGEVDPPQHVERSEPLVDVAADDDVVRIGRDGLIGHGFSLVAGCRGGHRVPTPMARSSR